LAFLLVTIGIDMLGLGLVVPIVPSLMTAMTGHAASPAQWSGTGLVLLVAAAFAMPCAVVLARTQRVLLPADLPVPRR
jgi:hypothetical protein